MNSPINLSIPWAKDADPFKIDIFGTEQTIMEQSERLFTEAVFSDGKASLAPILECIGECKKELLERIGDQDASVKEINDYHKTPKGEAKPATPPKRRDFDPKAYWKADCWRKLEDRFCEVFGLRTAQIMPFIEKYNSKSKDFQSHAIDACVYTMNRYPIEAIVTDRGFYDKSKSVMLDMRVSLGAIKDLTNEEILAIMLHEIGHGVDPALVDIKYIETNILSKYITDRKYKINKDEQKVIKQNKLAAGGIVVLGFLAIVGICHIPNIIEGIKRLFMGKKKYNELQQKKRLDHIKEVMNADKRQFNRQVYSEAFADNFARMYGYGSQLISALKKMDKEVDRYVRSRYAKEKERQEFITELTLDALDDVHKTTIHRAHALIREYEADLKDPNIPEAVKKQIREDKEELEKVLNCYFNEFDAFQNRVNKLIDEELQKLDKQIGDKPQSTTPTQAKDSDPKPQDTKPEPSKKDDKPTDEEKEAALKEGVEYFDESKKAYEKLMKAKESLTTAERTQVREKFGSTACSFAKDKDGYYCFTHRARSKSYPSIDKIPQSKVNFVSSTA